MTACEEPEPTRGQDQGFCKGHKSHRETRKVVAAVRRGAAIPGGEPAFQPAFLKRFRSRSKFKRGARTLVRALSNTHHDMFLALQPLVIPTASRGICCFYSCRRADAGTLDSTKIR